MAMKHLWVQNLLGPGASQHPSSSSPDITGTQSSAQVPVLNGWFLAPDGVAGINLGPTLGLLLGKVEGEKWTKSKKFWFVRTGPAREGVRKEEST